MEIIKESNVIPYSSEKLYSYIIDVDNYEQILKDEIRSFDKLSEKEFKIKIGNMPGINLLLSELPENNEVKLSSNDINLNSTMVSEGWAIAYRYYSKDYVNEEKTAKINRLGIWQGEFTEPYIWRKKN